MIFLQEVYGHDNIIKLHNVMRADNDRDLYLVFEFMETDLHAVIRANILEEIHKQYIMYQIFKSLKYMHSAQLLHRDLKPSNLLLNSDCLMKVADFGLARSMNYDDDEAANAVLTDYVATRWYRYARGGLRRGARSGAQPASVAPWCPAVRGRAPEILLGSTKYTMGVDMWSIGCIFGELMLGKPMFPGTSTMNQIDKILEVTGMPSDDDIAAIKSPFAPTMLDSLASQPNRRRRDLKELFPRTSPEALDLLKGLLQFNPNKRMTAQQALEHPYEPGRCTTFHPLGLAPDVVLCPNPNLALPVAGPARSYVAQFHHPQSEISAARAVMIALNDNEKKSTSIYRDTLYAEVARMKHEGRMDAPGVAAAGKK